jgi:serine/threonine-protein kinase
VRPDGTVKVLDFGIATAPESPIATSGRRSPALLTPALTEAGILLGTAAYMSPEQARGKPVDERADIWAFGCLLYEMLTGQPAFGGEDVTTTLARVLERETNMDALPRSIPSTVRRTIKLCLEKDPRKRIADIRDVRLALGGTFETGLPGDAETPRSSNALRLGAAVAAAAVVAGAAGWLLRPVPAPEPGPVVRFSVPLPPEQSFIAAMVSKIAVSPDGARIAYVATGQMYLRNVGEREARLVEGTAENTGIGAVTPVFSPDGQWLAYVRVMGPAGPWLLRRVPISGGASVTLHNADGYADFPQGLTWPTPDAIMFADAEGIVRIPADGGATEILVERGADERLYSPQLLPGGEAVLFTRAPGEPGTLGGFESGQVVVQSIGRHDRTVVQDGGSAGRYLPSGHLVYAQGTSLFAVPFDPNTRAVRGGPVPMVEGLRRSNNGLTDTANFAVSDTGTLATIPGAGSQGLIETTLTWVDRDGREEPFPARPDDYTHARISPDGTKVALVVGGTPRMSAPSAIWIFDQRTANVSLLTADGDDGRVWSSDGGRIFFRSVRGGPAGVYAIELDSGETTLVGAPPDYPFALPWTISPDDRVLGIVNPASLTDFNIATLSVADGELTRLLHTEANENEPSISPNGAWIAYQEGVGDASEINIRPFPAVSRTRIPVGPGWSAVFSRDGSELFFFDGQGFSVAPITYEPALRVGTPRRLFESSAYVWVAAGRPWDADPSGERFLMVRVPGTAEADLARQSERIDIVLNWFEELEQRVPTE